MTPTLARQVLRIGFSDSDQGRPTFSPAPAGVAPALPVARAVPAGPHADRAGHGPGVEHQPPSPGGIAAGADRRGRLFTTMTVPVLPLRGRFWDLRRYAVL